jgi:pimeloyl-ACP methyl ester carboxylesterase
MDGGTRALGLVKPPDLMLPVLRRTVFVRRVRMRSLHQLPVFVALGLAVAGCSTVPRQEVFALRTAAESLRLARKTSRPAEERAAYYLEAASSLSAGLGTAAAELRARDIYNHAAAELTHLLRSADAGRLWNRPLEVGAAGASYRLRFSPGARDGAWAPDSFTDFKIAEKVRRGHLRQSVTQEGFGGTLVGIKKTAGLVPGNPATFEPGGGFVAPVTATLEFRGRDATLTLNDPERRATTRVGGVVCPLAADYTAPIASRPARNELWAGLMEFLHVQEYLRGTGLYMLEPYDPDRIPVIFVHGLVSTPQMWVDTINEIEADPQVRGRYQYWVFRYPTGNPLTYSAMRFREELARMQRLHPMPRGFVLVGHSLGGLVARIQATTSGRALWDANLGRQADRKFDRLPAEHLVKRVLIFEANPEVRRIVFICTPHRGSDLAIGSIGALAMKLIELPKDLIAIFTDSIGDVLNAVGGRPVIPNAITSLSPKNPTLIAMDQLPIRAIHHSIIGDRGKGNTPQSSDGAVPYSSSHLASAKSELIVPGPHSSYALPETIEELRRILREHAGLRLRGSLTSGSE